MKRNRSGFTLLEFLVALAVVIAAVAALLPAVSASRNAAVTSGCLANQLALGIGYQQYIEDYNFLPINYQEGTYWCQPVGRPYFYGGVQAWMANGPDFWNDYLYGPNHPTSQASGMGLVYPYIGGDGKTFYCPGTAASFTDDWGRKSWYGTWTGDNSPLYKFGEQGTGTVTTYFYRGGFFDKDPSKPDNDPAWQPFSSGWTWNEVSLPTSPWVANRPILTCFWVGYNGETLSDPLIASIPHEGTSVNLLNSDGSAKTWTLPANVSPVWGWFGVNQWGPSGFNSGEFYAHMPWWWVIAERAD